MRGIDRARIKMLLQREGLSFYYRHKWMPHTIGRANMPASAVKSCGVNSTL
jgi:hypothetical protein